MQHSQARLYSPGARLQVFSVAGTSTCRRRGLTAASMSSTGKRVEEEVWCKDPECRAQRLCLVLRLYWTHVVASASQAQCLDVDHLEKPDCSPWRANAALLGSPANQTPEVLRALT